MLAKWQRAVLDLRCQQAKQKHFDNCIIRTIILFWVFPKTKRVNLLVSLNVVVMAERLECIDKTGQFKVKVPSLSKSTDFYLIWPVLLTLFLLISPAAAVASTREDTLQNQQTTRRTRKFEFFYSAFYFLLLRNKCLQMFYEETTAPFLWKIKNQNKTTKQGLLPRLTKKRDSCPFTTSPDSQSDSDSCCDIRLSALVDDITISINVQ